MNATNNCTEPPASTLASAPWVLPKKPSDPAQASEAHVLAHADQPRLVRVCYTTGPEGSHISARANTNGGTNVATRINLGACVDIGGTDVELSNPNATAVAGTYALLA